MTAAAAPRVLLCPDKFKGTATAQQVTDAMARALQGRGGVAVRIPMADGGDGTLDALGGPNRTTRVTGPLGRPVDAAWRLRDGVAVVEAARCCGLVLAGGATGNDPLAATSRGVAELLGEAIAQGATRVVVAVGGVATTDGGRPVVEALGPLPAGVRVEVACDVRTAFVDAARDFAPQKGADPRQVAALTARLRGLRRAYRHDLGVDVGALPGAGAAGGLAGGLAAIGATLVPGFDLVAGALGLPERVAAADLVLTGEGRLDGTSFDGKVVGGVAALADAAGVPWAAVVGTALAPPPGTRYRALDDHVGPDRAVQDTLAAVQETTDALLRTLLPAR